MFKRVLLTAALAAQLTGCASIVRGTTEPITISYSPATAKVTTNIGQSCPSNPCTIIVKRNKQFTVTATAPGYETVTVPVLTKLTGRGGAAMAGNVLAGGIIGVGVDAATGAGLDHYPNPVVIKLRRTGSAPAPSQLSPATGTTPVS